MVFVAVLWNGFLLLIVTLANLQAPWNWQMFSWNDGFLLLFPLAGVSFIRAAVTPASRYARTEWIAGPNRLERHDIGRRKRITHRYENGEWRLAYHKGSDSGDSWELSFYCRHIRLGWGAVWDTRLYPACTPEELRALGEVLAEHTGWPFSG